MVTLADVGSQKAYLVSPQPNYEIYIFPQPQKGAEKVGYGSGGDEVKIIEEIDRSEGGSWYLVKFAQPPYVKGWVEDYYVQKGIE